MLGHRAMDNQEGEVGESMGDRQGRWEKEQGMRGYVKKMKI